MKLNFQFDDEEDLISTIIILSSCVGAIIGIIIGIALHYLDILN